MAETSFKDREKIEWSNTWLSEANCRTDRCLLIGDSLTRELRGRLEEVSKGWFQVDLFAASFSITDKLFWSQFHCFLRGVCAEGYIYKYMVINYGFHHGFGLQCVMGGEDAYVFKERYRELIQVCKHVCKNVIIMNGSSMVLRNRIDIIDAEFEREILARNVAVKELAVEMGCKVFDVYGLLKEKEFKYVDHVHLERQAYVFMAQSLFDLFKLSGCESAK